VTTLAGSSFGFADGNGISAQFTLPAGVVTDAAGNVYVADQGNHKIRKIDPLGNVTTLTGGTQGFADGNGAAAMFNNPARLTIDGNGNLYVADQGNHKIRKLDPLGNVTTIAGSVAGYGDGNGISAKFNSPSGIAIDVSGNVYVADQFNNRIRKIDPQGNVSTLSGSIQGFADGSGASAKFSFPSDLVIDANGNVYVADPNNNKIRKIAF
jgi:streptogramin lyase